MRASRRGCPPCRRRSSRISCSTRSRVFVASTRPIPRPAARCCSTFRDTWPPRCPCCANHAPRWAARLALAVAYLNVQKIRMETRLAFDVDVPAALNDVVVPPMILATLVENAVVHGLGPMPEGGRIRIDARTAAGRLAVEVTDTGRGLQDEWGSGVGLANIRARLSSEFGDAASLNLAAAPTAASRRSS